MKTVLVDPDNRVNGDETVIDPEVDLLAGDGDPPVFSEGEKMEVHFPDSPFSATGVVTKLHKDEFGLLVQLKVDWNDLRPL